MGLSENESLFWVSVSDCYALEQMKDTQLHLHTFGPKMTPPPTIRGDREEPRRALPVPFCL